MPKRRSRPVPAPWALISGKGTPRYISPREAARILANIPSDIWTVGVFVDETPERVREIAAETGVAVLQFHGSESPEYLEQLESFVKIKAVKVGSDFQPEQISRFRSASAFLLDGFVAGMHGGTGKTFDWSQAQKAKALWQDYSCRGAEGFQRRRGRAPGLSLGSGCLLRGGNRAGEEGPATDSGIYSGSPCSRGTVVLGSSVCDSVTCK